ncbi:MetQ/NlpA family ABC transporter substrate-binding protein [Lacticaseibacillus porcinae]|uniref:MetQ/NlpA family ABC transporter substrate-binding protein n=1 Tax=Lacticaseibacillus porcinae TaxID=1123687 RepID=UPI000F79E42A|nr:MetQ/NlpA family ABC transporter substrate-binding protein [Lacticaseibacillus porcinae]
MKLWKKIVATVAVALPVLALAACGNSSSSSSADKTVKVGIMSNDVEIWSNIQKRLKKQGVNIKLVQFTDYNTPNKALQDGDVDLNAFQNYTFLDDWNKKHGTKIVSIGDTYLGPIRAYSTKIKSLNDLKKGDTVSVPNDASNEGRALNLLAQEKVIKLKAGVKSPSTADITENKLDLQIKPLDSAQTARSMNDVAAAVVNNDIAAAAKLKIKDSIAVEKITDKSSPYINFISAKSAKDKKNKTYQKIVKAYQTKETAKLMKKVYKGTTVPAWK